MSNATTTERELILECQRNSRDAKGGGGPFLKLEYLNKSSLTVAVTVNSQGRGYDVFVFELYPMSLSSSRPSHIPTLSQLPSRPRSHIHAPTTLQPHVR